MTTDLILLGAGGFARETADAVNDMSEWNLLGFLDDNEALHNTLINGVPVLGSTTEVKSYTDVQFVACMGSPSNYSIRERVVEGLGLDASRFATIVHPLASISKSCRIGPGTVVLAGAVLTTNVSVGSHTTVMPHVLLTHDNIIGDFVSLTGGVKLAGGAQVERGAYIGSGAIIDGSITVGEHSQIGAASYVRQNVPPNEVWWGIPATFQRKIG